MKRFIAGLGFPVASCILLAAGTVTAFAVLAPTGSDIGNEQILKAAGIGAWAIGPVAAILSLIFIGLLNGIRRIIRMRNMRMLHAPVVALGIAPWAVFAWNLSGEPRFTPIARAVIDFGARPLLWGSLITLLFTAIVFVVTLLPAKKS